MSGLCCLLLLLACLAPQSLQSLLASLAVGAGSFGIKKVNDVYCRLRECCGGDWLMLNSTALEEKMNLKVFGQHMVRDVVRAVSGHLSSTTRKPLVISLHGPTGTGKSLVSDILWETLFKAGKKSRFVHEFIGSHDFPHPQMTFVYRKKLLDTIAEVVARCPRLSLILIDEADKFPTGLSGALRPIFDFRHSVGGVDYRNTIFVLRSNAGQEKIAELALKYVESGSNREEVSSSDTEKMLRTYLYNLKEQNNTSGFYKSEILETPAIDHFIAFFPLERRHVEMCIRAEALQKGISDVEQCVESVIARIEFFPVDSLIFSAMGCKKVPSLVLAFCY